MIKSPITGKEMTLCRELAILVYHEIPVPISYHYFLCGDSGEHFTDDELDSDHMFQVYQQYRSR